MSFLLEIFQEATLIQLLWMMQLLFVTLLVTLLVTLFVTQPDTFTRVGRSVDALCGTDCGVDSTLLMPVMMQQSDCKRRL